MATDSRRDDQSGPTKKLLTTDTSYTLDGFKLLFDADYRGQAIGLLLERGLPMLAGVGIIIVGISFVLAGSTAGQAGMAIVETVATKGKNLIGTGASMAKEAVT